MFLALFGAVLGQGSTGDGETRGGCNGSATHIGLAGALGGGTLLARVCGQGDTLARLGSRTADDVLQLGSTASKTANPLSDGASGIVAAGRVDELYNRQWEEAAEIIGRLASDSDVEKHPGYWREAGVDLYMNHPEKWTELGGDGLLSMASVRSPAMRSAVKTRAKQQFDHTLTYLSTVEHVGPRTVQRVHERYGVDLIEGPGQSFQLELRTADYVYRLLDAVIEEEPISERARFTPSLAENTLRDAGAVWVSRERRFDVAGLHCFSASWPESQDEESWHAWVGPGLVLSRTTAGDFERLAALTRADEGLLSAEDFATLWTVFHRPVHAKVCPKWHETPPPQLEILETQVIYRFSTEDLHEESCQTREVRFDLDGSEERPDPLEPEREDQGGQAGSGVGAEQ
jgi:hypothetical protein